jgi:7-cyano-7-deazaguanine synthase in queuosine biosynthesis
VIRLNPLSEAEILTLLQRLAEIHALNFGYEQTLINRELKEFVQEIINRLGAEALLTPGEIVRDFMSLLNILHQNSGVAFGELIHGSKFKPTAMGKDADIDEENAAEFSL